MQQGAAIKLKLAMKWAMGGATPQLATKC